MEVTICMVMMARVNEVGENLKNKKSNHGSKIDLTKKGWDEIAEKV
eukprot:CAMPEP_0175045528 /NCGR_PEP_ID=MMETSP0052_2-20121109/4479_1 /TAXON_ID=51329 ORGANISM="Polytomella parva, Strain SAG 63-3" /NCGR_SAMPLE_ID=MMETSP0052_2 /ASSEMBLY_ACC=CAM_ASM_000194 /LENGTH=45 /DNA_ID= /DNA_START= /DNA_END= /DNA_ORIENTATION=